MEIHLQALDAAEAVDAAVRLVAHRAESKRQRIDVQVDADVRLRADERAFKQILLNLLSNALKFSPEGGRVAISCSTQHDGVTRVIIEDSGPGIPADKVATLFRPFSRVDNRYDRNANGTGLGLALVRGLVALHDGKVWVENKSAGGLMAIVEFPGQRAAAKAA
jgi:two-component system cell cycle sensor histidine kinase PleC